MNQNSGWLIRQPRKVQNRSYQNDEGAGDASMRPEQFELLGAGRCGFGEDSAFECRRELVHRFDHLDVTVCQVTAYERHVLFPPV